MNNTGVLTSFLLGGAIVTLLLQTITLVGLIWKGGRWSQRIESEQKTQDSIIARIVTDLDAIEKRVGHLEGRA